MVKRLFLVVLAVALAGCAATTPTEVSRDRGESGITCRIDRVFKLNYNGYGPDSLEVHWSESSDGPWHALTDVKSDALGNYEIVVTPAPLDEFILRVRTRRSYQIQPTVLTYRMNWNTREFTPVYQ